MCKGEDAEAQQAAPAAAEPPAITTGAAAAAAGPEGGAAAAGPPGPDYKQQGNAEYQGGRFLKAATLFTQGLRVDPTNAVLYSNRSAALLQLNKCTKALADAEECIRLRPEWEKGHFRQAAALEAMGRQEQALAAYMKAAALAPDSRVLGEKVRTLSKLVVRQQQKGQPEPGRSTFAF